MSHDPHCNPSPTSQPPSSVAQMSPDVRRDGKTNPVSATQHVTPGPTTTSAPPAAPKRMAHCQEMSGDPAKRCQVGVADPLTPIQHRALELLAAGMKISATARRLCVDERTIYRWKKQPAFLQAIRRGCQMPVMPGTLERLRRPVAPKKKVWRYEGKTFATVQEYLAELERVSPATDLWLRLQGQRR